MNRNRLIFYGVFGTFHLGAFIFTIILEGNTSLLFKLVSYVHTFKWITLLGLILLIADVIWSFTTSRTGSKEKSALTHELNTLKAKLFDAQETNRKHAVGSSPEGKK
jgi:hypothetical protein